MLLPPILELFRKLQNGNRSTGNQKSNIVGAWRHLCVNKLSST